MDLVKAVSESLKELKGKRDDLDRRIGLLENALKDFLSACDGRSSRGVAMTTNPARRRGRRRPMTQAEKDVVSKRMIAYWAEWRKSKERVKGSPGRGQGMGGRRR
jgi:hypothetical protein